MNQRYQEGDIRRIAEQYADNGLYMAICTIGLKLESEMSGFGLCPEECFMEVSWLLERIADNGEDTLAKLDDIWLSTYNGYRRLDRSVNEDETRKVVGVVFAFAAIATDSSTHHFYRYTLSEAIIHTLYEPDHKFGGMRETIGRIFSVPLPDGWFDKYFEDQPETGNVETLSVLGISLPNILDTERARKYFKKAMDCGYISVVGNKLKWNTIGRNGEKSQVAYFCGKVYGYKHSASGNNGDQLPTKDLEELFGVKKLLTTLNQVYSAKSKQAWRSPIDELFE